MQSLPTWLGCERNSVTHRVAAVLTDDLQFALQLADVADAITLRGFTDRTFGVHSKEDSSDVTDIDRAAETALRELVISARPDHGFYGEEHGRVNQLRTCSGSSTN